MKRIIIAATMLIASSASVIRTNAAVIGEWNAYMAYNEIKDIEPAGNTVFVLCSNSLFSYNVNDQSVSPYNKINGLNDSSIKHIAWNGNTGRLIIIYLNGNIDLLDRNGNIINIPDYYNKTMTEDKTINNVIISGIYAYLSTNFGILKVNMRNAEISETYKLGIPVITCTVKDSRIYAQTLQGIYSAAVHDNLIDKANWHYDSSVSWEIFVSPNDIETTSIHGYTELRTYDDVNRCWWSNQQDGRLQSYTEQDGQMTVTRSDITADGPKHNHFGFMTFYNGRLYTCGSYIWDLMYDATIQVLADRQWDIFQGDGITDVTGVPFVDMMCVAVDPLDPDHVVGGSKTGVYEFYGGRFARFHNSRSTNGTISSALSSGNTLNYELITAACFDNSGNLWCFNLKNNSSQMLLRLGRDGQWTAVDCPNATVNKSQVKDMITDSRGNLWFANNHYEYPAVFRYDIENGVFHTYNNFVNQDNTGTGTVRVTSVMEDNEGNIWAGTDKGPILLNEEQINDPSKGFTQIKIPRDDGTNNADYLMANIEVSCMAVDGANRKWIGTPGFGVYLISSDNMEEVSHFTATNSNLLSDNIESIAINNSTGEVFIGTDIGLCSYMSDATEASENMDKDNVYAYPNPVTPGYDGLITVVGLSLNANVKILTANGVVVAEGTSNGGMFTWNGRNSKGERVASGVYMVATAKQDGSKGTVCKIAIVR